MTPPEWYYVSIGNLAPGEDITVITTEDSKVYLVPAGTLADLASIKGAAVSSVEVTAYIQANFATYGLSGGDYVVYALDSSNNISRASPLIILQNTLNSPVINGSSEIFVSYNFSGQLIIVRSTNDIRQVDVYSILGKKIISKECKGKIVNFHTAGFVPGLYIVRVSDILGNEKQTKIYIG